MSRTRSAIRPAKLLISKSAVSEITDRLSGRLPGLHHPRPVRGGGAVPVRRRGLRGAAPQHGAKEALLVAWCIDSEGRKHLLHLAVGYKESEPGWTEFFRGMLGRGLRLADHHHQRRRTRADQRDRGLLPRLDQDQGAGSTGWPTAAPSCHRDRVRLRGDGAPLRGTRRTHHRRGPRRRVDRLSNTYRDASTPPPWPVSEADLDALLAIHRVPVRHRIRV